MKRNVALAFRRDSTRRAALARFAASVRAATAVSLREMRPPAAPVGAKTKPAQRKRRARSQRRPLAPRRDGRD
jgi:hypothetical protein